MRLEEGRCECGARFVGEPVLEPSVPQPQLGAAAGALLLAAVSTAAFWFRPLVAAAGVAVLLGARAALAARRDPERYGGLRTATAGLVLGGVVALVIGGLAVARVPRMLENRREAREAATRAEMYHLAGLLHEYRAVYGAYPERVGDLDRLETVAAAPEARDSWERKIVYTGYTSGIASAAGALTLNANFELRSPGPDGLPNTPDDIVMRDGSIVDAPSDASPAPKSLSVTPLTNRAR
jgi:hypothetical protein